MKKYLRLTALLVAVLIASVLFTVVTFANEPEDTTEPNGVAAISDSQEVEYNTPLPPSGDPNAFAEYVYHKHDSEEDTEECLFCLLHKSMTEQKFGTYDCPYCINNTMHPLCDYTNFFLEYAYFSERDTACYLLEDMIVESDYTIKLGWEIKLADGTYYPPARGFDSPVVFDMNGYNMVFGHYISGNYGAQSLIEFYSEMALVLRNGNILSYNNYDYYDGTNYQVAANGSAPIFGFTSPYASFTLENVNSASAGLFNVLAANEESCPEINVIGGTHYVIFQEVSEVFSISAFVQSETNANYNVKDATIIMDEDGSLLSSRSFGKYDDTYESKSNYLFENCTIVANYQNTNLIRYTNDRTKITFLNSRISGSITPTLHRLDAEFYDYYTEAYDVGLPVEGDRLIEFGRFTSFATVGTAVEYREYHDEYSLTIFEEYSFAQTIKYYLPRREYTYTEKVPMEFSSVTFYGDIYDIEDEFSDTRRLSDPSQTAGGKYANLEYFHITCNTTHGEGEDAVRDFEELKIYFGADVTYTAKFDKKIVNVKVTSSDAAMDEVLTEYVMPGEKLTLPTIDTETVFANGYYKYQYTGRWLDKNGNVIDFDNYVASYNTSNWESDSASITDLYPEAVVTPYLSAASYSLTLTTDILLNVVIPRNDEANVRILSVTAGGETVYAKTFIDFDGITKDSFSIARPGTSNLVQTYEAIVKMEVLLPGLNAGRSLIIEQRIKNLSAYRYINTVLTDSENVDDGTNVFDPAVHVMMADLLRYSDAILTMSAKADAYTAEQKALYAKYQHLCSPISADMTERLRAYGVSAEIDPLIEYVEYITFAANHTSLTPIIKFTYEARVTDVQFTLTEGWVHGEFSINNSNWGETIYAPKSSVIYWSADGSYLVRRIGGAWYKVDENGNQLTATAVDDSLVSNYIAVISPDGLQIYNIEKMMNITLTLESGETVEGSYGLAAYYATKLYEYERAKISPEVIERISAIVLSTCAFGNSAAGYRFGAAVDENGTYVSNLW